jgi:co-chaperonin GroES (HSP10)
MTIQEDAAKVVRTMKPTGDRVLVRLRKEMQKVGLIYLPDGGKSLDVVCSEVIAVGPDVKARPWHLAAGDFVLHVRVVGVSYDGVLGAIGKMSQSVETADYKFLKESEILATVNPESVGKISGGADVDGGKTGSRATSDL